MTIKTELTNVIPFYSGTKSYKISLELIPWRFISIELIKRDRFVFITHIYSIENGVYCKRKRIQSAFFGIFFLVFTFSVLYVLFLLFSASLSCRINSWVLRMLSSFSLKFLLLEDFSIIIEDLGKSLGVKKVRPLNILQIL